MRASSRMGSTRSTRCPACRTIICSMRCSRRRIASGPFTRATSRARPTWRSAPRSRPASRRPVAVVPGPGLLNASAALLTAYSMNAPVLALVGQIPERDIGRKLGHLHEINDQAGIIARLVDHSALIPNAEAALAHGRRGIPRDGGWPPGPGRARMSDQCVGQAGERHAVRSAAARAAGDRRGCAARCRQAACRGEEPDDRGRRRRAGCLARGHRARRNAAGAGAVRIPPRPGRARQPQSARRDAAARPRIVGRGGRGAGGRHAAVFPAHDVGRRR